jgi:hypothetical protein
MALGAVVTSLLGHQRSNHDLMLHAIITLTTPPIRHLCLFGIFIAPLPLPPFYVYLVLNEYLRSYTNLNEKVVNYKVYNFSRSTTLVLVISPFEVG